MSGVRQVDSPAALIFEQFDVAQKNVVDVGCGIGDLARAMASKGARVIAIDRAEMLARAREYPGHGEAFVAATGESLPLSDGWADAVLYIASLHHIPTQRVDEALRECTRVLKPGGHAIFVEPLQSSGSWGDMTRLVEDESEVQKRAYEAIVRAAALRLTMLEEEHFFMARSFGDFEHLINTFVDDASQRPDLLARARALTTERSAEASLSFADYRYRSYCRMNVLRLAGDRRPADG